MKKEKFNYSIYIFKNKKLIKHLFSGNDKTEVTKEWENILKSEKPPFIKEYEGKRNSKVLYEVGFVIPSNFGSSSYLTIDVNGEPMELFLPDRRYKVKKLKTFWREEKIYDFNTKKRIGYDAFLSQILKIKEICQVYTLNKNIFVQTDKKLLVFGNKNVHDSKRLLDIVREDIIKKEKGNYIFIKDITTHQRKKLYSLLEEKGLKKSNLFKHYSY